MSLELMAQIFKIDIRPSAKKFVLLAMADNARDGICWPCIKEISEKTSLNRKTVIKSIDDLKNDGYLTDTKERKGRSGQVRVYQISMGPKTGQSQNRYSLQDEEITKENQEDIKESQKRDSPTFSSKESQNWDTEPLKEPLLKISTNVDTKKTTTRKPKPKTQNPELPDWLPDDPWQAFRDMRKTIRKTMTPYAEQLVIKELQSLMAKGHDPTLVLQQSIKNSWQDVYALKKEIREQQAKQGRKVL
jgi:pyocin large subunit-like protein